MSVSAFTHGAVSMIEILWPVIGLAVGVAFLCYRYRGALAP